MLDHPRPSRLGLLSRLLLGRWLGWLILASLFLLPGCGGCGSSKKTFTKTELEEKITAEKKKKKKKPKKRFEIGRMYSLPSDMQRMAPYFKPGHWTEFTSEVWANHEDFLGDLKTDAFKLDGMPYRLGSSRPAVLPKGVKKHLGIIVYAPPGGSARQLHVRLTRRGSNRSEQERLITSHRMKSWSFNFLVLAENPDAYRRLLLGRNLDSIRASSARLFSIVAPYYHMRIPDLDRYIPVSENALTWTSTAYVLWDGISPSLLTAGQQQAMLDWIHWGGQLIISGPGSLDALKDSFLAPYLPATAVADIQFHNDDLKSFHDDWKNKLDLSAVLQDSEPLDLQFKKKDVVREARRLTLVKPWSGKKLVPAKDSGVDSRIEVLARSDREDAAPLVVDRRVGLGRIVLTAFHLSQKELQPSKWPSFDAFFNGCLLRRCPREFTTSDADAFGAGSSVTWYQPNPGRDGIQTRFDAKRVSRMRFFSRDAVLTPRTTAYLAEEEKDFFQVNKTVNETEEGDDGERDDGVIKTLKEEVVQRDDVEEASPLNSRFLEQANDRPRLIDGVSEQTTDYASGVAGWSDFNHVSQLVRYTLGDAAGIVIPKADFVVYILLAYLIVLVPMNWLVFRLMGRVEWAWFAAPVITILFAVAVIKLAELDVGFARSRTELTIVEIQGEYPRAHVTRYTGLYTSLATSYGVSFQDPSSLVQPFPLYSKADIEAKRIFQGNVTTVHYRRDDKQVTLRGFDVSSNATGMLHSEQMLDLGGGIRLVAFPNDDLKFEVINRTLLNLKGAALIRHGHFAWIGDFDSGVKKTVTLQPRQKKELNHWFNQRETADVTSGVRIDDLLKARLLIRIAEHVDTLAEGELRLVAWTDKELPGMEITPRATQSRFANVIVAHLRYGRPTYGFKDLGKKNHDMIRSVKAFEDKEKVPRNELSEDKDALKKKDNPPSRRRFNSKTP